MKQWKEQLAQEIVHEWKSDAVVHFPPVGETDRAVKFSDVARAQGHSHIARRDIKDIAAAVVKLAPELHPIRVVRDPGRVDATESAWSTLYFTDLDFSEDA